jgi:hypothetical protein
MVRATVGSDLRNRDPLALDPDRKLWQKIVILGEPTQPAAGPAPSR